MDYLRGRGGKIKELEDELQQARSRSERLQLELAAKGDALAAATAENRALKAAALAPTASGAAAATNSALQALSSQLDEQLHRTLVLEQELATAKQREALASQRFSTLEAQLAEQRSEQARLKAEAASASARLRLELEAAAAEARMASQRAELAEQLAARRVEAEKEISKVTTAQLEELRTQSAAFAAELDTTRQRASRAEAEAAALRSSAQHVRLQLLEEELRAAREALAAAERSAAAAGPPAAGAVVAELQQQQQLLGVQDGVGRQSRTAVDEENRRPGALSVAAADGKGVARDGETDGDTLPAALTAPWQTIVKALGVSPGLPLPAQAAEAARAASGLAEEAADLRAGTKARDEQLMQLRAAASGSEAYAAELQLQLSDARSRLERALTAERVAERRAAAIEQERDALRAALAAPAAAVAAVAAENPGSLTGRLLAGQQAAAAAQLQLLNEQLQGQVAALQQEAAAARAAAETQGLAARAATSRADAAELRTKQVEKEADSLAAEVAALQERLGRGGISRGGGVRVLHLRHNPEAEAQRAARDAAVTQLGAENEALRRQVAELEGQLAQLQQQHQTAPPAAGGEQQPQQAAAAGPVAVPPPPALGGGVALAVKDAEIVVLRRKLEEGDKAMSRLKAVFKERITVFREACYLLFGYRVDVTAEATAAADAAGAPTTFTLKPQHADDPAALLVFRLSGGRMELVPNAFTRDRLAREVDTFVRKFACIPALTANLTMENFQKQTQC